MKMIKHRFWLIAASATVLVTVFAASWFVHRPMSAPTNDSDQSTVVGGMVTLTVGASGDVDTMVMYSCPGLADTVKECGPLFLARQEPVWSTQLAFPIGTRVYVQASGGALATDHCWIGTESDRVVLAEDRGARAYCEVTAQ